MPVNILACFQPVEIAFLKEEFVYRLHESTASAILGRFGLRSPHGRYGNWGRYNWWGMKLDKLHHRKMG
jgi:hypothetical protein